MTADTNMGNLGNKTDQRIRIGILEFMYHHVFLYSLASVANNCGAEVTIFTTKELYDLVKVLFKDKVDNYEWIIKGCDETIWSFLRRVEQLADNDLDLLFVNTIQECGLRKCPAYLSFSPKCKCILVTGRVTEWFGDKYQLLPLLCNYKQSFLHNFRQLLRYNAMHFVRKKILPRYDAIVVHSQSLKSYVIENADGYKKEIVILPHTIYNGTEIRKRNEGMIKFIVVGAIEEHRRDYIGLLIAFEKLFNEHSNKISLTFLGRPVGKYGKEVISKCKMFENKGFNIHYYKEYIPEEIYIKEVILSDVIINPIRLEPYLYGGFTAGLVEAMRNAKPAIYPLGYIIPKEFQSSSLFYDRIEDVYNLISSRFIGSEISFERFSQNAIANSENFSLEKISTVFQSTIMNWCLNSR